MLSRHATLRHAQPAPLPRPARCHTPLDRTCRNSCAPRRPRLNGPLCAGHGPLATRSPLLSAAASVSVANREVPWNALAAMHHAATTAAAPVAAASACWVRADDSSHALWGRTAAEAAAAVLRARGSASGWGARCGSQPRAAGRTCAVCGKPAITGMGFVPSGLCRQPARGWMAVAIELRLCAPAALSMSGQRSRPILVSGAAAPPTIPSLFPRAAWGAPRARRSSLTARSLACQPRRARP